MSRRRTGARVAPPPGVRRGDPVRITLDGRAVDGFRGESVAAAIIADTGDLALRRTGTGEPRGLFCGMGVCFECLAEVDGVPGTRTCVTWVREGMAVRTQVGPSSSDAAGGPARQGY